MSWLLLVLIFIPLIVHNYMCARGKIVLSPGEGTATVYTGFKPKKVNLKLKGKHPAPGCGKLKDHVCVKKLTATGFILEYKIETGVVTVIWRATRSLR